jgi:hypothetical protein
MKLDTRLSEAETETVRGENETEEAWQERLDQARGKVVGVARQASETAASVRERIAEEIERARQSVMRNVHDMQDRVAEVSGQVSSAVKQAGSKVMEGGRTAQEAGGNLVSTVSENPLILGALAVGVGALAGILIPQSEQEAAALQGMATRVRGTARDVAQTVVDRGSEVANKALSAGQESARAQGLSGSTTVGQVLEDAQSGNLVRKVEGVAMDTLRSTETALRKTSQHRRASGDGSEVPS